MKKFQYFVIVVLLISMVGGIQDSDDGMERWKYHYPDANMLPPECLMDKDVGWGQAAYRRYYFDPRMNVCRQFYYSGCEGNGNNFRTKEACESRCVPQDMRTRMLGGITTRLSTCFLQMEAGDCRALIEKYYFDVNSKECLLFYYGGCGGNANNYDTREECEMECTRYYYEIRFNECWPFFYGGCGGNANNWGSKEICEAVCRRHEPYTYQGRIIF